MNNYNKPDGLENEMLFAVFELRQTKTGKTLYTAQLGFLTLVINEWEGKLYLRIQKWKKREDKEGNF